MLDSNAYALVYHEADGGEVTCQYVTPAFPLTVGSSLHGAEGAPLCDVPVFGEGVSDVHAILRATTDGYAIRALTRVGTTSVNGEQTESSELSHGDTIGVGEKTLHFFQSDRRNPHRLKLTISRVDWDGTVEIEVDGPVVFIGRDDDDDMNQVVISDGSISGQHLQLAYFGGEDLWVEDLESTNGSMINDEPLGSPEGDSPRHRRATLSDTVQIGRVTLQFSEGEALDADDYAPVRYVTFPDDEAMA